ncbi:hypothetical protein J5X84_04755 [Streptosporangiaceae bacterium NEAU-GS5]|nr:hypothetical protein [Streptosporangiaceae bacterium NEAU-GS5]
MDDATVPAGWPSRAVLDVVSGQILLFGGLVVCVALVPAGLGANKGFSFFGIHWLTVVPYAVGVLGCALFTRRALRAAAPATPAPARARQAADAFGLLTAGLVVTPDYAENVLAWTHRALGASLFVIQLVLAARLVAWAGGDPLSAAFWLFQLGGGVICAIYVLRAEGFLLQGQVLFQLAFGVVLARTLPRLPAPIRNI